MKTHTPNVDPTQRVELTTDLNGHPFVIAGDYEAIMPLYEEAMTQPQPVMARQTVVEAPKIVSEPVEQYINLGNLDGRTEARMALKALAWDIKTFGRNNEYRRFKEAVAAEKALAMDMELGLVQRVHCRLHERLLDKTKSV